MVLMASPMAHQSGFMYGLMMPVMLQAHAVLQDVWQAPKALEIIRAENVSFTMASTPFLTDLAHTAAQTGLAVPSLKIFLCAGAPIPRSLVAQARQVLGTKIISARSMPATRSPRSNRPTPQQSSPCAPQRLIPWPRKAVPPPLRP